MTKQEFSLLAIEASGDACSVALQHAGKLFERIEMTPRQHSQLLLPMVDELLNEAAMTLSDLDAIAFSAGPGSFTGLRLALGVAQGLAFGAELPLVAVSSLAALAQAVVEAGNLAEGAEVFCVVDARMGECYVGHYAVKAGCVVACEPDALVTPAALSALPVEPDRCVLAGNMPGLAELAYPWVAIDSHVALARHLMPLAQRQFAAGETTSAEAAVPTYLRGKSSWKSLKD